MKKTLGVISLILFSFFTTQAQQVNFGIKAGYNSSSVEIDEGDDFDSKSGFHIGGLAHIHISEHFAVQPELVFSTQGGERTDSKLNLNYINVPILAQYMLHGGFRLQTGPQFGFLVSAEQKVGDVELDIDDSFNSLDLSWSFGAGYVFTSGFGIDFRYNLGLNNISDNSNFEAANRVVQLGLFYQFRNNSGRKK